METFPRSDISVLRDYVGHITKTVSIWNGGIENFFCGEVHVCLTFIRVGLKLGDSANLFVPRSVVTGKPVHALTFVLDGVHSKYPGCISRAAGIARDISSWKVKVFHLENGM